MAAVLCNACGDICNGACEVCGHVCSKPCAACGQMCDGCGEGCANCCRSFGDLCSTPFSIYVTVAVIFNLPSVYFGLMEVMDLECRGSQWLFVNALLCAVNIVAAFYMAVVVSHPQVLSTDEIAAGRRPSSPFARAGYMFCYDPWIAVYILVLIFFFCWLWTGGIWSLNGKAANGCQGDTVGGKVATGLGFGWAFYFFGIGALMIGMCCAYCAGDTPTHATSSSNTTTYYGTTEATGVASAATPFVNADAAVAGKASKMDAKVPTVAATPAPVMSASTKQDVPTVQATIM